MKAARRRTIVDRTIVILFWAFLYCCCLFLLELIVDFPPAGYSAAAFSVTTNRLSMAGMAEPSSRTTSGPRRSRRVRESSPVRISSSLGGEPGSGQLSAGDPKKPSSGAHRLRIGLIADIQYAPIPDGYSYTGTPRYYRHALEAARHAARHFEAEKVGLVVNLGYVLGFCEEQRLMR